MYINNKLYILIIIGLIATIILIIVKLVETIYQKKNLENIKFSKSVNKNELISRINLHNMQGITPDTSSFNKLKLLLNDSHKIIADEAIMTMYESNIYASVTALFISLCNVFCLIILWIYDNYWVITMATVCIASFSIWFLNTLSVRDTVDDIFIAWICTLELTPLKILIIKLEENKIKDLTKELKEHISIMRGGREQSMCLLLMTWAIFIMFLNGGGNNVDGTMSVLLSIYPMIMTVTSRSAEKLENICEKFKLNINDEHKVFLNSKTNSKILNTYKKYISIQLQKLINFTIKLIEIIFYNHPKQKPIIDV